MSEKNLSENLIEVLRQSTVQSNERMDQLATTMNSLAKTVERSEERHLAHTEGLERIGTEVKELSKKMEIYTSNNDTRVMDVEKQVLLLDNSKARTQERFNKQDKFIIKILTMIFGAAAIIYLGFK